jgi:hypothetical protein
MACERLPYDLWANMSMVLPPWWPMAQVISFLTKKENEHLSRSYVKRQAQPGRRRAISAPSPLGRLAKQEVHYHSTSELDGQ